MSQYGGVGRNCNGREWAGSRARPSSTGWAGPTGVLIGNSVFLRLSDVASGLPAYEEQIILAAMDWDADATGFSQKSAYEKLFEKLRHAMVKALADGSRRLLSTYLQSLLAYPDGCTRGETVFNPASGEPLIQVPPLAEDRVYPKEKALLDLVAAERLAGRRVLVYATHTGTRDITGRMDDMLTRHGSWADWLWQRGLDNGEIVPLQSVGVSAYRCSPKADKLREDLSDAVASGRLTLPTEEVSDGGDAEDGQAQEQAQAEPERERLAALLPGRDDLPLLQARPCAA